MNKIAYPIILSVCIFCSSCSTQKINQSNKDRLYKKENNELNSKFTLYHLNDSVSQLFFEISNEVLVYKRTDTSNYFYSDVKLLVKISSEDNLNSVKDTVSIKIIDRQSDAVVKFLKGFIFLNLDDGSNYDLDINVIDNHKKTIYSQSFYCNKENINSRQNFLVTNYRNEIFYNSYYKPEELIYLQTIRNKDQLYNVDVFKGDFKIALPPFSMELMPHFSYKPDSTYAISKQNGLMEVQLPKNGFLHLKTNKETKEGVTFFVYESSFPRIKNADQMILSTRYIMAKKEFDNCMQAADKKAAIDKFWLDIAGSNERAKELIKKYYGRVQESNKLFSSFQEGWKTDRGMIYIVFGAPSKVTKRKNGEIWTYGEIGNPNSIVFDFMKVINPFTENDYYLERSDIFKSPWYQAVDMWRQGRVYLDN